MKKIVNMLMLPFDSVTLALYYVLVVYLRVNVKCGRGVPWVDARRGRK